MTVAPVAWLGGMFLQWLDGAVNARIAAEMVLVALTLSLLIGVVSGIGNRGVRSSIAVADPPAFLVHARVALRHVQYGEVSSGPDRLVAESRRLPRRIAGRVGVLVEGHSAYLVGPKWTLSLFQRRLRRLAGQAGP